MICSIFTQSHPEYSRGMTYVELIVVVGIFSILSSAVIFNYRGFQARVDIKNLASDVAQKVVEAQNSSLSGKFPPPLPRYSVGATWRPSFGVYIDKNADNKSFLYFTDLNNDNLFEGTACTGECIEKVFITKGNSISRLDVFYRNDETAHSFNNLTISFTRPNGAAIIKSSQPLASAISYVQITVLSPSSLEAEIKIYPSGRIQIN